MAFEDFKAQRLGGEEEALAEYKGKVVLVVNTASKCGFTPQFEGLEMLYQSMKERGLVILGFPCNQFGSQEPGSTDEIAGFCQRNYGVSFPMFEKIEVNGPKTHPLYDWLKKEKSGVLGSKRIKWNFTKFLINRDGEVVQRYAPTAKPEAIAADVEALL